MKFILLTLWGWCTTRAALIRELKRLTARLDREKDASECLARQRDTALETLERIQWASRRRTAENMAVVESLKNHGGSR